VRGDRRKPGEKLERNELARPWCLTLSLPTNGHTTVYKQRRSLVLAPDRHGKTDVSFQKHTLFAEAREIPLPCHPGLPATLPSFLRLPTQPPLCSLMRVSWGICRGGEW
jgi:hypothetical protein